NQGQKCNTKALITHTHPHTHSSTSLLYLHTHTYIIHTYIHTYIPYIPHTPTHTHTHSLTHTRTHSLWSAGALSLRPQSPCSCEAPAPFCATRPISSVIIGA